MNTLSLGAKIKSLRKKAGMNQKELAAIIPTSYSTFRRWENNQHTPDLKEIYRLAEVLNTTVTYLLEETDNSSSISFSSNKQIHQALTLAEKIGQEDFNLKEPITGGISEQTITIKDCNTNTSYTFPNNEEGRKAFVLFLNYSMGIYGQPISNSINGNNNSGNKLGVINQ